MTRLTDRMVSSRKAEWVLRLALLAWAAFWLWFVAAVSWGEQPSPPWWIPTAWVTFLAVAVLSSWRSPIFGGLLLSSAAVWAMIYFANPDARLYLAGPALVLGLGFLTLGWLRTKSRVR